MRWCKNNSLVLNVIKTKELIMDFRNYRGTHSPISLDGWQSSVASVSSSSEYQAFF